MAPHSPHDDVYDVGISPDFENDRTIFVVCRDMFLKSTNGGRTWTNVVRGLNNMFQFFTDTEQRFSLSIAPGDKHVLMLASRGDGLYRSTDFGTSWARLEFGDAGNITKVVISPHSADVAYAAVAPQGLIVTRDAGATWEPVAGIDTTVTAIAVSPERADDLFAGDDQGTFFASRDGGRNWDATPMPAVGRIRSIDFSPDFANDRTIVVGTATGGVLKSTDSGATFAASNAGLDDVSIASVAFSPDYATNSTLWVSTWTEGVYISRDAAKSWQHYSVGLTRHPQKMEARYDERPHFSYLHVGRTRADQPPAMFLAGFDGLFSSEDEGRSWRELETLPATLVISVGVSPEYAKDSSVAVTTYINGAFLSEDGGDNWKPINNGLEELRYLQQAPDCIARLFAMRFSPTYAADNTLFCAGWTYVLRSTNRGSKWTRTRLSKASIPLQQLVMTISPDYEHDRGIYMGNRFGDIYRSRDGGKSFDIIGNAGGHVRSLVLSPEFATDSTMFAAIPKNPTVRVSVDGGETWSETARGLPRVMHLAMSPNYGTDRKLFAGTRNGLFVTTDQGQHWERVGEGAFGQSASCIESLAVSPDFANDNTLFVSVSGKGLFKSTDAAATFRPAGTALLEQGQIFANIPNPVAVPIVFSPAYATDGTLFGYSPTNVFRSTDRGETWSDISPKKTIHEMEPLGDRRADARVSQPVQLSLDAPAPIAVLETKPEAAPARERAAAGNGKAQAANPPAAGQAKAGPAKTEEPNSLRSLGRKVLTRIRPRR